jgi:hypothetical protein
MTRAYNTATTQQNSGGAVAGVTAGKNAVINGGMDVWQRGTSFTGTTLGAYGADRWGYYRGGAVGGATWTRQSSGLTGFQYSLRAQRNSGDTSTQYVGIWQGIETINSIPFAGKTVTVSFYAKAGANYSASANGLGINLITGTGTDEPPYNFTGSAVAIAQYATLTTSWQRFTFTATLPAGTNEISIQIIGYPTGTAGANDWFEVTGVQLEQGSVATPFSRAGGTIQGELSACMRYYQALTTSFGVGAATGQAVTTASGFFPMVFRTPMRGTPSIALAAAGTGNGQMTVLTAAGAYPGTTGTFTAARPTAEHFVIDVAGFTSAFTAGNAISLYSAGSASTTTVYTASAEL